MAKLPIILVPDPVLKAKCAPVDQIDDEVRRLMDDMLETMYEAPGIGLAAPQVGVTRRIIVIDCAGKDEPPAPIKLVNPEIIWASDELATHEEGCLSIPEHYAEVTRPAEVKVRYRDESGKRMEVQAGGLLGVCLQHEIDHLDGVLFVDHISSLKRNMILRKLAKARKQREREEVGV